MELKSVQNCLDSNDPLSKEVFEFLLNYKEEDALVDYKVDFDFHGKEKWMEQEKWLDITKDIMAFANTHGGYLVFGIRDGTFDLVGLNENVVRTLTDTTLIQQKVNRYLDPPINSLRSKPFVKNEQQIVGLFIPVSAGTTHIISKDGSFSYTNSKKEETVFRKGTIYVRQSAGNHLVDSRDLDSIIDRRMAHFKESLLKNITQIVKSPVQSKVVIVSDDPSAEIEGEFVLGNGPNAILLEGRSFTTTPKTVEEHIAAAASMFSKDNSTPADPILWDWYKDRHSINLSEEHRIIVAMFCIYSTNVPLFFWLQGCKADSIGIMLKKAIKDATENRSNMLRVPLILKVSAFLGKRFYNSILKSYDNSNGITKNYPVQGSKTLCNDDFIKARKNKGKYSEKKLREELEEELSEIIGELHDSKSRNKLMWKAKAIDCYLYAQDDEYR